MKRPMTSNDCGHDAVGQALDGVLARGNSFNTTFVSYVCG